MSIITSTDVANKGLVVNIDSVNSTSYVGPPIQNIASTISNSYNSTSESFYMVPGYEKVDIPSVGVVNSLYMDMYNNYPAVSTDCCPAPINYGYDLVVSPSTLYTYAILYKSANRYTHPNYMYRYEYTSGGTYVTEGGIFSTGNETHLGNGWYWAWGTFTTNVSTGKVSPRAFMYQYVTYNRLYIAKVLLTPGNYTALHPKKWPDPGTTRSTSQALVNLSRKGSITANSLTYDTAGNFTFNGSSNYYTYTPTSAFNMYCLDVWLYNNNAVPNNESAIGGPSTYQTLVQFNAASPAGINLGAWTGNMTNEAVHIWSSNSAATYNRNSVPVGWHNFVFNWNGTSYDIWIDGAKTTTYAISGGTHATLLSISSLQVGYSSPGYYFNGGIPVVKCYNRQVSDNEVIKNFNSLRGRFGI